MSKALVLGAVCSACADSTASDSGDAPAMTGTGGVFMGPPATGGAVATPGTGGMTSVAVPPAGTGGVMAGTGGMAGMAAAGMGGMAAAGMGGMAAAGTGGMAAAGMGGMGGMMGSGACCPDGDCLCHGPDPTELTAARGPYATDSYSITGVGCVHYPTDGEPPYSAVAISDGFLGSGGCSSFQTGQWGPLYASHGIVAMIVNTGSSDQPAARGRALTEGIAAFKEENTTMSSPLFEKLAGRYGTSGFSMGGGGTTYAAAGDDTLLTNVAIMPWGPTDGGDVTVPSLVICGSSDGTASCSSHGTPFYNGVADTVPKMRVVVSGGHNGQPTAGGSESGRMGLAFQKVFLDGDERWRPLLVGAMAEDSTVQ